MKRSLVGGRIIFGSVGGSRVSSCRYCSNISNGFDLGGPQMRMMVSPIIELSYPLFRRNFISSFSKQPDVFRRNTKHHYKFSSWGSSDSNQNIIKSGRLYGARRQLSYISHNYHNLAQQQRRMSSTSTTKTPMDDFSNENGNSNDNTHGTMKLFNTMTETVEPILPTTSSDDKPLGIGWYTCGPTTYAPAHLGHARTYVCLDILRRVLTSSTGQDAPEPLFVLNITDVDDKILAAATKGKDPVEWARKYEKEFWRDWDNLNCLRPHIVTRVTEHVDSHIVPFIEDLVKRGMAYELREGGDEDNGGAENGVYFDVRAFQEKMGHMTRYGKLAPPAAAQGMEDILLSNNTNQTEDDDAIAAAADISTTTTRTKKRDSRDFCLWKNRATGQESLAWSSPWGIGRPGWHIECSAMIEAVQQHFKDTHRFSIHAGGIDLKFPHHTNEIAQSEAYLGVGNWIPHWVHTGHLHIDGLKMSKSLKNFVSIQDYLEGRVDSTTSVDEADQSSASKESVLESPSDDFRLWCLGFSGSYRGSATFSLPRIHQARVIRFKILEFLMEGETWIQQQHNNGGNNEKDESIKKWETQEYELFNTTDQGKRRGLLALENDLDGSTFVTELMAITKCGMTYIMSSRNKNRPVEPLLFTIQQVRELLRLVGFTKTTTEAGITVQNLSSPSKVDENALIDSIVQFRSMVREVALEHHRNDASAGMENILALSDSFRDSTLPEIGVQIIDDTTSSNANNSNDNNETTDASFWKFCFPRKPLSSSEEEASCPQAKPTDDKTTAEIDSIPISEFFKVGQYQGVFSEYSNDGMPTHNADGSEVSKRMLKKLSKKREKHRLRLQKKQSE